MFVRTAWIGTGDHQKYVKGWGVRSPDFVRKGSFLCEYIGEYISDDEAESRGTGGSVTSVLEPAHAS